MKDSLTGLNYLGIIEVNEHVFTIVLSGDQKELIAGTTCNIGLLDYYHHLIDDCFSIDENLQAFVEYIEEQENIEGELNE